MADINLLRDRASAEKKPKKKADITGVEFTKPPREKDEVRKKIKGGGVLEFFKSLFRRKPKTESPKQVLKKEEPVKKEKPKKKIKVPAPAVFTAPKEEKEKVSPVEKLFHSAPKKEEEKGKKEKEESEPPEAAFAEPAPKPSEIPAREKLSRPAPVSRKPAAETPPPPQRPRPEKRTETKGLPPEEKTESLDVNLIPEDVLVKLEPKAKLKQLGLVLGVLIILVGSSYGYLLYKQSQISGKIEGVKKEIASVEQEIIGLESVRKEASSIKKKVDSINLILNSHIYWSQFLTLLEQYTLPKVYYTNLAGNVAGKVTLTAKAPDLKTLSNQYVIFQNAEDFVESVVIENAVTSAKEEGGESVDFSISLTIKPEIFYKKM